MVDGFNSNIPISVPEKQRFQHRFKHRFLVKLHERNACVNGGSFSSNDDTKKSINKKGVIDLIRHSNASRIKSFIRSITEASKTNPSSLCMFTCMNENKGDSRAPQPPSGRLGSAPNLVESKFKKIMKCGNQDKKTKPQKATNFKKSRAAKQEGKTFKCHVCGLPGHKAYQCQHRSDRQNDNKPQMHVVEEDDEIIAAVVSEVNMVENNSEWVVDTGASKHFLRKEVFHRVRGWEHCERVYMGNSSSSEVLGKGKVLLKLTSGKLWL
ncbi:hypothetical protein F3Y22_tig00117034pilonHSYRG01370 [Hibiscus syriacus]|uniref:Retrovirus-related Pol polyprotein from transposon TNT 1-94-like beta-barrel domain-containing protein n=1 Tax=Hibiscus syriacus TaxID=106335 RepID=A0A6A2WH15_HIBSY|nr:hypothetical protein F3Y22_tig00117034pilonHSYRG01370 [Hibiscus syriacus]